MGYKVIFTDYGQETFYQCLNYILNHFGNVFAAKSLYADIKATVHLLEISAHSYSICEDPDLARRGIRKIHLRKHKYKILYRITSESKVEIV